MSHSGTCTKTYKKQQFIPQISLLIGKPLFSYFHCLVLASSNSFRVCKHNVKCVHSVLSKTKSSIYFNEGHYAIFHLNVQKEALQMLLSPVTTCRSQSQPHCVLQHHSPWQALGPHLLRAGCRYISKDSRKLSCSGGWRERIWI